MIGAIYGDIAGSKYEFNNIRRKDFDLFDSDSFFTDDTVCTVAIMDFLMHAEHRDEETMVDYMQKWTRKYPDKSYGGRFYKWIFSSNPTPYKSYGNGGPMRVSPVAYAARSFKEVKELSNLVTKITHSHYEAMKASYVVATCIFMALHNFSKEQIREFAVGKYPIINEFDYEKLKETYTFNELAIGTAPQAIYCFLISSSLEDCARTSVSIGGDSDTLAAISCSIAEAYYGASKKEVAKIKSFLTNDILSIVEEFEQFEKDNKVKHVNKKLTRFIKAQEYVYPIAVSEFKTGRKYSDYIWYIFPQLKGLGAPCFSDYYGIKDIVEAKEYYDHPLLRIRLENMCEILLDSSEGDICNIVDVADSIKIKSSLTLFYLATKNSLFKDVINKYYGGELDDVTVRMVETIKY